MGRDPRRSRREVIPLWTPCICGEFWCNQHHQHAHECDCPPIEELDFDPYTTRPDSTPERK